MPKDKGKGTGEPDWTEEEKNQGAPTSSNAGEAVPKAGYGGNERAATEAVAAQLEEDLNGEAGPNDHDG